MSCAFRLSHRMRLTSGCQFDVPEDELEEFGPKSWRWCRFHLPLGTGDDESQKLSWNEARVSAFNETVFASIDSAKKEGRWADLSGVAFPANISFEDYNLPNLLLLQAAFGGDALFSGVMASGNAFFDGTTFHKDAFFESATFAAVISFRNARFDGVARFKNAKFDREAGFHGTTFKSLVDFEQATFGQGVTFDEATSAVRQISGTLSSAGMPSSLAIRRARVLPAAPTHFEGR